MKKKFEIALFRFFATMYIYSNQIESFFSDTVLAYRNSLREKEPWLSSECLVLHYCVCEVMALALALADYER